MAEPNNSNVKELGVDAGRKEYLVTGIRGSSAERQGLAPMSAGQMAGLKKHLEESEDIEVLESYRPKGKRFAVASAMGNEVSHEHHIVRMDSTRAAELQQSGRGQIIVGENLPLRPDNGYLWYVPYPTTVGGSAAAQPALSGYVQQVTSASTPAPAYSAPPPRVRQGQLPETVVRLRVLGVDDKPVAGAAVALQGAGLPQSGKTNAKGEIALSVILHGDQPLDYLQVSEVPNCWDYYVTQPRLDYRAVNLIRLVPLGKTISGFPAGFTMGWGQQLMGLGLMGDQASGEGVKVAVVDSGADASHPLLSHITRGESLVGDAGGNWAEDVIGHGTHVSGVIGANGRDGSMRGFVPGAEIHALKIFPGGQLSTLIEALDYCIENQIDVVNLSLGTNDSSDAFPAVEQKIEEAAEAGVACIVAAGNSSGPVQYPASSPMTLAVSALGKEGEFPDTSWNAATVNRELLTSDGFFFPSYSCLGAGVNVCAPGSAIVSTWPGGNFAPDSGTSMAAPHVTGLAAVLLAHHPIFKSELAAHNLDRVRMLFSLITQISYQLPALGAERTGAGIPTLHKLLGR